MAVYNVGNSLRVELITFVEILEDSLGRLAMKSLLPMQPGDVIETAADTSSLWRAVGFRPSTPLRVGLTSFSSWFRSYYANSSPTSSSSTLRGRPTAVLQ